MKKKRRGAGGNGPCREREETSKIRTILEKGSFLQKERPKRKMGGVKNRKKNVNSKQKSGRFLR